MAITDVQSKHVQFDNVDSGSATFDSSTTTGNLIAVSIWGWRATGFTVALGTVTDNKSNTYAVANEITNSTPGAGIHYKENASGGASHQVTVDPTGTGNYFDVNCYEVSGIETSSALDQSAENSGNSTTPGTGNITTTVADTFMVAVLSNNNPTTLTVSAGWTQDNEELDNANHQPGEADSRIVGSTGTYAADWTTGDVNADLWAAVIAAFKGVAAAGDPEGRLTGGGKLVGGGLLRKGVLVG
jgi:hypothetical protein